MDPFKEMITSFHEFCISDNCFVKFGWELQSRKPLVYRHGIARRLKFDELKHILRTKHYNKVSISLIKDGYFYKIDGGGVSTGQHTDESGAVYEWIHKYF